jgi:hypothetical protein
MRRAIIIVAAIFTVAALMRWWLSAEQRRLRDVSAGDKARGVGSGDVDLDEYLRG